MFRSYLEPRSLLEVAHVQRGQSQNYLQAQSEPYMDPGASISPMLLPFPEE